MLLSLAGLKTRKSTTECNFLRLTTHQIKDQIRQMVNLDVLRGLPAEYSYSSKDIFYVKSLLLNFIIIFFQKERGKGLPAPPPPPAWALI